MRKHVQILAWLYILLGLFGVLAALAAFGVLTGIGILSGDPMGFGFMALMGTIAGFYFLIMSVPSILVGVGLLQGWGGWVIVLAVILGVLSLPNFPFGTAIGVYTFWVAYRLSDATESFG
jgi:hypothetical protein